MTEFVKVCAYFPYPAKVWGSGHEWVKRQAVKAGIGFTGLAPRMRLERGAGSGPAWAPRP